MQKLRGFQTAPLKKTEGKKGFTKQKKTQKSKHNKAEPLDALPTFASTHILLVPTAGRAAAALRQLGPAVRAVDLTAGVGYGVFGHAKADGAPP